MGNRTSEIPVAGDRSTTEQRALRYVFLYDFSERNPSQKEFDGKFRASAGLRISNSVSNHVFHAGHSIHIDVHNLRLDL